MGQLGWPAKQFWGSTLNELMAALRGKNADGDAPESGALSKHLHDGKQEDRKRSLAFCAEIKAKQMASGTW